MFRKYSIFTELVCLIGLTTGCGVVGSSNAVVEPTNTYQIQPPATVNTNQNGGYNSTQFNCRGNYTITPHVIEYSNGTDTYQVCRSNNTTDYTDLMVQGMTLTSTTICMFPAVKNAATNISPILNQEAPVYQCASPVTDSKGTTATYFNFGSIVPNNEAFNAAYIIEDDSQGATLAAMKYCLFVNFEDDTTCSSQNLAYSFGSF